VEWRGLLGARRATRGSTFQRRCRCFVFREDARFLPSRESSVSLLGADFGIGGPEHVPYAPTRVLLSTLRRHRRRTRDNHMHRTECPPAWCGARSPRGEAAVEVPARDWSEFRSLTSAHVFKLAELDTPDTYEQLRRNLRAEPLREEGSAFSRWRRCAPTPREQELALREGWARGGRVRRECDG
jgi:hypothetical protein